MHYRDGHEELAENGWCGAREGGRSPRSEVRGCGYMHTCEDVDDAETDDRSLYAATLPWSPIHDNTTQFNA